MLVHRQWTGVCLCKPCVGTNPASCLGVYGMTRMRYLCAVRDGMFLAHRLILLM